MYDVEVRHHTSCYIIHVDVHPDGHDDVIRHHVHHVTSYIHVHDDVMYVQIVHHGVTVIMYMMYCECNTCTCTLMHQGHFTTFRNHVDHHSVVYIHTSIF